jgi:hypothetical protein
MSKTKHKSEEMQGEGNKEADRRYRHGVKKTVDRTSEKERTERARNLSKEDAEAARAAESKGRAKARS